MLKRIGLCCWLVIIALIPAGVFAQESQPGLQLGLTRNFGYGGGGKIQGSFTLKVKDPPDQLVKVVFFLDGQQIREIHSAPFQIQFNTSDYSPGEHSLSARGFLNDGTRIESKTVTKVFLSSEQAWAETQRLIIPVLIITGGLSLFSAVIPVLLSNKTKAVVGVYGMAGGAVCPRCRLPFSRPVFSPNLVVGKLVRCPHCGKRSVLGRATQQQLKAAEEKYALGNTAPHGQPSERDFYRMLEDSRFDD